MAELSGVSAGYGGCRVLDDISLKLRAGEIAAVLGPNGAGKSTLVNVLRGRLPLLAGTVRVAGADPRTSTAAQRTIGWVPQAIALYKHLTVRENLHAFGRMMNLPRHGLRERVDAVVDDMQLGAVIGTRTAHLSGGFQRRLNIAVTLLGTPSLLLLDEPTVGIDRDATAAIQGALARLRSHGLALLLITHDLHQAVTLADRVCLLVRGRILRQDRLTDLLPAYGSFPHRVAVHLSRPATPAERDWLRRCELAGDVEGLCWRREDISPDLLPSLIEALRSSGLPVREVAARTGSVEDAYRDLVGGTVP